MLGLSTLHATDLYVSPSGNDRNSGVSARPLRTLVGARDAVRKLPRHDNVDVNVYFRAGVYPFTELVEFEERDSGQGDGRVVYRALKGDRVIFDGCGYVGDWVPFDKANGIYKAHVSSKGFRQLYVNGHSATRARYPNREKADRFGPFLPVSVESVPDLVISSENWQPIGDVANGKSVELVVMAHWYQQYLHIAGFQEAGGAVSVKPYGLLGQMGKPATFYKGALFHAENALEFLDDFDEWYFDRDAQILYYKPPANSFIQDLSVGYPVSNGFVLIRGRSDMPVRNIEFNGIVFQCANWTFPTDHSLSFTQFAQPVGVSRALGDDSYPPGAISVMHARNVAFRDNVIKNVGGSGIQFYEDVDDSDVEGNRIHDVSGNAIEIDVHAMKNPPPERQSEGVVIWNNEIFRAGQSYSNGGGILAHNVRGLILEHNWIYDMPYSCVQVCDQPGGKNKDVGCGANRIRFNRIQRCVLLHDDGGGIYTLGGVQRGTVIANNYISDVKAGRWAGSYPVDHIYLDNFTTGILVYGNVVVNGRAAERNGSHDNFVVGNRQVDRTVDEQSGIKKGFLPVR